MKDTFTKSYSELSRDLTMWLNSLVSLGLIIFNSSRFIVLLVKGIVKNDGHSPLQLNSNQHLNNTVTINLQLDTT